MSESNQATAGDIAESETAEKYLTIQVAEEHYGVKILRVREIIGMQDITPLPRMPKYVRGVINLRGKIIPVVDLRMRLGMDPIAYSSRTCIVVLDLASGDAEEGEMTQTGCIVDTVSEVREIPESTVEAPPDLQVGGRSEYVLGLAKLEELNLVVSLLEIDSLLSIALPNTEESTAVSGAA